MSGVCHVLHAGCFNRGVNWEKAKDLRVCAEEDLRVQTTLFMYTMQFYHRQTAVLVIYRGFGGHAPKKILKIKRANGAI